MSLQGRRVKEAWSAEASQLVTEHRHQESHRARTLGRWAVPDPRKSSLSQSLNAPEHRTMDKRMQGKLPNTKNIQLDKYLCRQLTSDAWHQESIVVRYEMCLFFSTTRDIHQLSFVTLNATSSNFQLPKPTTTSSPRIVRSSGSSSPASPSRGTSTHCASSTSCSVDVTASRLEPFPPSLPPSTPAVSVDSPPTCGKELPSSGVVGASASPASAPGLLLPTTAGRDRNVKEEPSQRGR